MVKANPENFQWLIGKTLDIPMSGYGTITYRVIGIVHDEDASSSSKLGITFQAKNIVTTHAMGGSYTTGWTGTSMKSWINSDLLNTFPSELQKIISSANKIFNTCSASGAWATGKADSKLWIASCTEMTGTTHGIADGSIYAYWSQNNTDPSRILTTTTGGAIQYWSRTVWSAMGFSYFDSGMIWRNSTQTDNSALGVVPCFCI